MERYTGCMLGPAIGEALGALVERFKEGCIRQLVGEITGFLNPVAAFPDRLGKWRAPPPASRFTLTQYISRSGPLYLFGGAGSPRPPGDRHP